MKHTSLLIKSALLTLCLTMFAACSEDLVEDKVVLLPPVISEFSPKSGSVGSEITIKGENLQKIDSVFIGGGVASIKYLINANEMVVEVTNKSLSGEIKIHNSEGYATSADKFTLVDRAPILNLETLPVTGKVGEQILIEGKNMDAVLGVYFGTVKATIISQSAKDVLVSIPFFTDGNVDIFLAYNTITNEVKTTGTTDQPFSLDMPFPQVTVFPSAGDAGSVIDIEGTNLALVEKVIFGDKEAVIESKSDTKISVSIPEFDATTTGITLRLVYYQTSELVLTEEFEVTVLNVHYWSNKTIYAQGSTIQNNFFDAVTGKIYTPCDYPEKKDNIYFFLTISASTMQINNPTGSANQTKNFKCSGVALPTEIMTNTLKFKKLNVSVAAENDYITKVKAKTLTSLSQRDIDAAGITKTSANTLRYDGASNLAYNVGDVLMFQLYASDGVTPTKVGFIEVTAITTTNPTSDQSSSITFNCYYEK